MSVDPALVARARRAFADAFDHMPALVAHAPGRVNLIGEHTDYNDGFVLPCAIDRGTVVAVARRDDGRIVVTAADYGAADAFDLAEPIDPRADAPWANYVRGVVLELLQDGRRLPGLSLAIAGDVPQGAGLSSSASLEVALGLAISQCAGLGLPPEALARLGQRAENDFVGCACGIMDQLTAARGEAGHAILIDCRSLDVTPVPIPSALALIVIHSRVARGLVDSAYNERRRQCEAAARHYGVPALRDLDEEALLVGRDGLDPVTFARARHIVTENARTIAAAEALRSGDIATLSSLMAASHRSMRDDFAITVPAIDRLVEIASAAADEEGGVRMTGGGFGGCVVALVAQERAADVIAAVEADYRAPSGEPATIFLFEPSAGAAVLAD